MELMNEAHARRAMRITSFCLMPNHIHLQMWPWNDGDLSAWMQWLLTTHARRMHKRNKSSGHVWQGRFHSFPVQTDQHLLVVERYIERNPVRAGLVQRAQDWIASSASSAGSSPGELKPWLVQSPVPRPPNWIEWVNQPQTETEIASLRRCVHRGTPFGEPTWVRATANQLGLRSTLNPHGRPKKLA